MTQASAEFLNFVASQRKNPYRPHWVGLAFIAVCQTIASLISYPMFKPQPTDSLGRRMLAYTLVCMVPVGWSLIVVAVIELSHRISIWRDAKVGKFMSAGGTIRKCASVASTRTGGRTPMQYVQVVDRERRLKVPADFWSNLPEEFSGEIEYLKHSKLVFKVNEKRAYK
jgi:hypothetical protein